MTPIKKAEKIAKEAGGELSPSQPMVTAIVPIAPIVPEDYKHNYSRAQIEIIKEQFAKGASDAELRMFLYVCKMSGLDPFSRQIHLVPRWDSRLGKEVRMVIFGIDGLRSIAEKTGAYAGNSDPIFEGEVEAEVIKGDKTIKFDAPARATVTVKKIVQGVMCDFTATAEWDEYYPGGKGGIMYYEMPRNQLGKCAEAKALRKGFPAVMSGRYVDVEIQQAITGTPEAQNAPQSDFDKASGMISKITDPVTLGELKGKFEGSPKYTAKEKKALYKVIDQQLEKLQEVTVVPTK